MPRYKINITNKKRGALTAVAFYANNEKKSYWLFRCDCGREEVKPRHYFLYGNWPQCSKCVKPAYIGIDEKRERSRSVWSNMKQRCYNNKVAINAAYMAKGITVCDDWKNSFKQFLRDMGQKPDGKLLTRIDLSKGYNKRNCIWATRSEIKEIRALLS